MKIFILKLGVVILKLIYFPFRLCKIKNKITYMSRQSDAVSVDFELLIEAMQTAHPEVENVVLARKITGGKHPAWTYPIHMLQQMYHLATSKIVILDGYCIAVCLLPHKKETKVIQLWHAATAIKKFGYQTIGKPSGSSRKVAEAMGMHKNYDYVLASSKATAQYYCQAFQVEPKQIQYIGMPHYAQLFEFDQQKEMDARYPELKQKQNIIYIPTFRKGKPVNLSGLIEGIDFEKYNLIARLHPLELLEERDERVIFDSEFTVYDWIKRADIIIADYSSLIVECAILNKKMYFFLYDVEDYTDAPGLNIDFASEELGNLVFYHGKELNALLQQSYDEKALRVFTQKYVEINPKNSIQDLVEFIERSL